MKIHVEQFHIKCGTPKSGHCCPIAYALGPRIGGHIEITEDGIVQQYAVVDKYKRIEQLRMTIRMMGKGELVKETQLPKDAVAWMQAYDKTGEGTPFEFEFDERQQPGVSS